MPGGGSLIQNRPGSLTPSRYLKLRIRSSPPKCGSATFSQFTSASVICQVRRESSPACGTMARPRFVPARAPGPDVAQRTLSEKKPESTPSLCDGILKQKAESCPGPSDSTQMRPPCSSTIRFTIARSARSTLIIALPEHNSHGHVLASFRQIHSSKAWPLSWYPIAATSKASGRRYSDDDSLTSSVAGEAPREGVGGDQSGAPHGHGVVIDSLPRRSQVSGNPE